MTNLTIIVPVFNEETYVGVALDSILRQKYQDFKVVILDNNSSDKTGEICKRYADNYSQISYMCRPVNVPMMMNLFLGIMTVETEYCTFLSGDDYWRTDHLSYLMPMFEISEDILVVASRVVNIDSQGSIYGYRDESVSTLGLDKYERYRYSISSIPGDWNWSVFKTKPLQEASLVLNRICVQWSDYSSTQLWADSLPLLMATQGRFCCSNQYTFFKRSHSYSSDRNIRVTGVNYIGLIRYVKGYGYLLPKGIKCHEVFVLRIMIVARALNIISVYSKQPLLRFISRKASHCIMSFSMAFH